jgi:hypothetical protein
LSRWREWDVMEGGLMKMIIIQKLGNCFEIIIGIK